MEILCNIRPGQKIDGEELSFAVYAEKAIVLVLTGDDVYTGEEALELIGKARKEQIFIHAEPPPGCGGEVDRQWEWQKAREGIKSVWLEYIYTIENGKILRETEKEITILITYKSGEQNEVF